MNIYSSQVNEVMKKHGVSWFKFDETSSTIIDSVGSSVGTMYENVTRIVGWNGEGSALNFNRTSTSYIDFNSQVIPLGSYTIRFKMKLFTIPTTENQEVMGCSFSTTDHYGLRVWINTDGVFTFTSTRKVANSWDFTTTYKAQFDGKWRDYMLVWDTSNKKAYLYVDEILVSQDNTITQNTAAYSYNLRIGNQRRTGENRFFEGQIDELQIYNVPLTPNNFMLNKALILHDSSYKKWVKGNPLSTGENLIPKMTSATLPSGEVITSGSYDTGRSAWKAFDGVNNAYTGSWASTAIMPSWIGYKFPSAKVVNAYSLTSPTDNSNSSLDGDGMPKSWVFQGSNDDVSWIDLDIRNNESLWKNSEKRTYMFISSIAYKSYRLYVKSNNRPSSNITYISEIEMYTVVSYSPSFWQTVSSDLPTVDQFIDNGMDSLTPLLGRKVMNLEPQKMDNTIGILPQDSQPKVFNKKVDLNKYIDVRKIEVKK